MVNNKIYIGKQVTKKLQNSYYGSGSGIKAAIKKYGKENFKKEILFLFDNNQEMLLKEAEIVNKEFVKRTDTYNAHEGGLGGWMHVNDSEKTEEYRRKMRETYYSKSDEQRKIMNMKKSMPGDKNPMHRKDRRGDKNGMFNKVHSEESKNKMSKSQIGKKLSKETKMKLSQKRLEIWASKEYKDKMKNIRKNQCHENNWNPQGTCWWYSEIENVTKRSKECPGDGYVKGRKFFGA